MTQSIKRQLTLFLFIFSALFAFAGVNFASAQEATATVTITYVSNPDEVLGTFDVVSFSEDLLLERVANLNANLEKMRVALGSGNVDCASFIMGYEGVLADSVFFDGVPAEYAEADNLYQIAFVTALDRTRPAYFGCQNDGKVNNFDFGLAFTTLEDAIELGKRAQAIAEAVSGQVAMPPVDTGEPEMDNMSGDAETVRWTDIFSEPDATTSTGIALAPSTRVNVIMTDGAWTQIESEVANGYVPTNALDFDVEPLPEPAPVDEDVPADVGGDVTEDDIERILNDIYLEWNGETRSPRVNDAFGEGAEADFLRPAVVSFDARTFDAVGQISLLYNTLFIEVTNISLDGEGEEGFDCLLMIGIHVIMGKSPEFINVPSEYQFLVDQYEAAVTEFLRVSESLALTCLNGDFPDDAALSEARLGAGETFADFFALVIATSAERNGLSNGLMME